MGRSVKLVGKRFWEAVGGFFPEVCAIQEASEPQDGFGEVLEAWTDVEGMEEIRCRVSPSGGTERKSPQAVWSVATHVIELCGRYEGITAKMRCLVGGPAGQAYDILLPAVDGGNGSSDVYKLEGVTRLVCEVVR